tara:strand:- start:403 stop:744 length:342 start_codon:yes stop_codon:yes gene_type:complete
MGIKIVPKEGSTRGPNPSEIREKDAREGQKKYLDKVEKAGKPSKKKIKKRGGGKVVKKKKSIKAVDRDVSSDQFPEASKFVNKMGGGKIKGYKKGGPISYRMTGGQVVDNSYD